MTPLLLLPGKPHGRRSLVGCSPWDREESDTTERLHFQFSLFTFLHWRRKWQPTPVFLPGESRGWGSLVGCRLWGHTESDTTEATQQQQYVLLADRIWRKIHCMTLLFSYKKQCCFHLALCISVSHTLNSATICEEAQAMWRGPQLVFQPTASAKV